MKVLWIVLGVIGFLCLICAGGGYYIYSQAKGFSDEAGGFADSSFKAISANWNAQELISRGDPQFLGASSTKDIEMICQAASESLGPLKSLTSSINGLNYRNGVKEADWHGTGIFLKAQSPIEMKVVNSGNGWKILYFNLPSAEVEKRFKELKDGATATEPPAAISSNGAPDTAGSATGG